MVTLKCKALGNWEDSSEVTGAGNIRKQSEEAGRCITMEDSVSDILDLIC